VLKKKQKRKDVEEEQKEEEGNVAGCRKYGLYLHINL
jgi:hypothetical protein